jgi:hypothetical protein
VCKANLPESQVGVNIFFDFFLNEISVHSPQSTVHSRVREKAGFTMVFAVFVPHVTDHVSHFWAFRRQNVPIIFNAQAQRGGAATKGARTALSARRHRCGGNRRTRLSALLKNPRGAR